MSLPPLLLRADASAAIGTGHVMRCLALAQAWQDCGGRAVFACAELPAGLASRLEREQMTLRRLDGRVASEQDAAATIGVAREIGATWVVVDGYRFDPEFFRALRDAGLRVMCIDDMAHLARYPVDLLLNQNLGASRPLYESKISWDASVLLGPHFSLLRREFRTTGVVHAPLANRAPRVLVSFGGADSENFTQRILEQLATQRWTGEVVALAGAANPHVEALRAFAAVAPFRCEVRVNVENVAALMAWADVAVTAGGSTVWELAACRLPAIVAAISPDQRAMLPGLRHVTGFRALPVEELLACDLAAELTSLLATKPDFGGLDAHGAPRVVAQLTPSFACCP